MFSRELTYSQSLTKTDFDEQGPCFTSELAAEWVIGCSLKCLCRQHRLSHRRDSLQFDHFKAFVGEKCLSSAKGPFLMSLHVHFDHNGLMFAYRHIQPALIDFASVLVIGPGNLVVAGLSAALGTTEPAA